MKNTTQCFIFIFLVLFTFISIIAIWPDSGKNHDAGLTSAELKLEEKTEKDSTTDSSITTYTFVNAEEKTTFAIDRGYAVRKAVRNSEGKTIEERYFDADGNPVKLYDSYYGVKYEYRDHEVIIKYLDSQGNEMPLTTYSIIVRTLDDDGRAIDDYYYDLDMQPTQYAGYYGMHWDYDNNGWNNRGTYLDKNGQPVLCSSGYAIKEYKRDAAGTITGEFYFDEQGNPTKSSFGEYGQLYERDENGRISQIMYADADGNAVTNSAGYAIRKYTYYRDGTVDIDMYFDNAGNPVALSKGQYGIRHNGKTTLLMDKNGNVTDISGVEMIDEQQAINIFGLQDRFTDLGYCLDFNNHKEITVESLIENTKLISNLPNSAETDSQNKTYIGLENTEVLVYIFSISFQVAGAMILLLFTLSTKRLEIIKRFSGTGMILRNGDTGELNYNENEFVNTFREGYLNKAAITFIAIGYFAGVFGEIGQNNRVLVAFCVITFTTIILMLTCYSVESFLKKSPVVNARITNKELEQVGIEPDMESISGEEISKMFQQEFKE